MPAQAHPASSPRIAGAIAAALAASVLVLYAQTARFEFITLDDYTFIVDNPPVAYGVTRGGLIWAFTEPYDPNWHPITWVSHMVDSSLLGVRPGWYAHRPAFRRYLVVLAAYGLAIMSKTTVVSLPILLVLLEVWPLRRWAWRSPGGASAGEPRWLMCGAGATATVSACRLAVVRRRRSCP